MAISKRRMQFLDELVGMYQKNCLPVHYEALAKVVGVSKWTAYDMLKEIEKSGYVTRSYEVNPNETGRSQVVFTPTDKATELFMQQRSNEVTLEDWEESLHSIREMLNNLSHTSIQDLMGRMLDEIPQRRSNLEFCGYFLGILLMYLKKLGNLKESVIKQLLNRTSDHHSSLLMFAGTVLGIAIETMSDEISREFAELVGEHVNLIGKLSYQEQELLSDFVNEALA